jgi:hypothetical protein
VHCDATSERLLFPATDTTGGDPIPFYSLGDDDPAQRRALAAVASAEAIAQLHESAYPRDEARLRGARIDAMRARSRGAAISLPSLDDAFHAIDAVRSDLLAHDLDIVRDDLDLDRDSGVQTLLGGAMRCDLLYPIVITDATLWSLPDIRRHDWLRVERRSVVGHERRWVDIVNAEDFAPYAQALTRHLNAALRKGRFAPAGASSRS